MKATLLCLFALLAAGCGAGGDPPPAPSPEAPAPAQPPVVAAPAPSEPPPPRGLAVGKAWVIFGADTIETEIADTEQEREKGLQNRTSVPDGTGMLFLFTDEEVRSFWMSNTPVPLDIAFLNAGLRLIDIQEGEPESTDIHDSAAPAKYVLEVRKGWFADHRIRVGTRAELVFGPR